jgi:hypothetical protein
MGREAGSPRLPWRFPVPMSGEQWIEVIARDQQTEDCRSIYGSPQCRTYPIAESISVNKHPRDDRFENFKSFSLGSRETLRPERARRVFQPQRQMAPTKDDPNDKIPNDSILQNLREPKYVQLSQDCSDVVMQRSELGTKEGVSTGCLLRLS